MKPIAAPTHVAVDARWRKISHAITGIHNGALNVSRIAFISGGRRVIANKPARTAAIPAAAAGCATRS